MKIEDVNAVIEEAVDLAYEKACEVVTKRVKEETVKHDVDVVKDYGELLQQQPKDKLSRCRCMGCYQPSGRLW